MLAQLLRRRGNEERHLPSSSEQSMTCLRKLSRVIFKSCASLHCLPFAVGQARSLCKRLRARFPRIAVVVGLWGFAGGVLKAQERVGPSCTDAVCTNLSEAIFQIERLAGTVSVSPAPETARLLCRTDATRRRNPYHPQLEYQKDQAGQTLLVSVPPRVFSSASNPIGACFRFEALAPALAPELAAASVAAAAPASVEVAAFAAGASVLLVVFWHH